MNKRMKKKKAKQAEQQELIYYFENVEALRCAVEMLADAISYMSKALQPVIKSITDQIKQIIRRRTMREIIFRGKRKDNGEWVKGYIGEAYDGKRNVPMISRPSKEHLAGSTCDEIIPETVGQYTGLNDKNGKPIFEGDMVTCENYHGTTAGIISYRAGAFYLACTDGHSDEWLCNCHNIKIVGNIHDNTNETEGE